MKTIKKIIPLLIVFFTTYCFSQSDVEIKIKNTILKYASDTEIQVQKDSVHTDGYKVTIGNNLVVRVKALKKDDQWLVFFDTKQNFLSKLLGDKAYQLKGIGIDKSAFVLAEKDVVIKREDLPDSYQINILTDITNEKSFLNYELQLKNGISLIGDATAPYIKNILNTSSNTVSQKKMLVNTNIGKDIFSKFLKNEDLSGVSFKDLKLNFTTYHYFKNNDMYKINPLEFQFSLHSTGFTSEIATTLYVNTSKEIKNFFGFTTESDKEFAIKGVIEYDIDAKDVNINLTGLKKYSKNNILDHLPKLKLTDIGFHLFTQKNEQTNKKELNFNFIGKIEWKSKKYDVAFPKNTSNEYGLRIKSIGLKDIFPNFEEPLLEDLFKNVSLESVYLHPKYFEAKLPFNGTSLDLVGFKQEGDVAYNLSINFPSLNLNDFLTHEAGFHFPDIEMPDDIVSFYIPKENLKTGITTYQLPDFTTLMKNIPSLKLRSFFYDKEKYNYPKNGFKLDFGLSLEHFDLSLHTLFGDTVIADLGLDDTLKNIKLTEINITHRTLSCKFPIGKSNLVKLLGFKTPNKKGFNFIFQLPDFNFSDYISGINSTPLGELPTLSNIQFIHIPKIKSTNSKNTKENKNVSWKFTDLPMAVQNVFPQWDSKKNVSLEFSKGFNFYAPTPNFKGTSIGDFLSALGNPKIPAFKGSINPKFLFKNWSGWSKNSSSSSTEKSAAKNDPQVSSDSEFTNDFYLNDIPLPEFSVGNLSVKEATLSIDGIKFDVPYDLNVEMRNSSSEIPYPVVVKTNNGKKWIDKGKITSLITADLVIDMPGSKQLNLKNTVFLNDATNNLIRFKTIASQEEKVKDENGEEKLVPSNLFKSGSFSIPKLEIEGLFNYETKYAYTNLFGEIILNESSGKKHLDFDAKLHYDIENSKFTPFFHLTDKKGFSFSDFNLSAFNLPNAVKKLDFLKIYDIEVAENYFFVGLSQLKVEQQLDSTDYIIGFKAKGQTKYNLGAKSQHLITTLLHDAPHALKLDNFKNEEFRYIPSGNGIQSLNLNGYPAKIIQHFNPKKQATINLSEGKIIKANYSGDIGFGGVNLNLDKAPITFNIPNNSSTESKSDLEGLKLAFSVPNFSYKGVSFLPKSLQFEKKNGKWNVDLDTEVKINYNNIEENFTVKARQFTTSSNQKGIEFNTSTSGTAFKLPEQLNFVTYTLDSLYGKLTPNTTKIDLYGKLKFGNNKSYKAITNLKREDSTFNNLVITLPDAEIKLSDIDAFKSIYDADKISLKNPKISLNSISADITYKNFNTSAVVFKGNGFSALILKVDGFNLKDIIPESSTDLPDINLKETVLFLSSNNKPSDIDFDDLPSSVKEYFKGMYKAKDKISIPSGISLFSKFNPSTIGGSADFFKTIGLNSDYLVSGSLASLTNFELGASLGNSIQFPDGFEFIKELEMPKFYIGYSPGNFSLGLKAVTNLDFNGGKLKMNLDIAYANTSMNLSMNSLEAISWDNPMGLHGLSFEDVEFGISADFGIDPSFNIDFSGALKLDDKVIYLSATIPATGKLTDFAVCGSADELSFKTFAVIANKLTGGKLEAVNNLPMDLITFKNVKFAFVPPTLSSSTLSCNGMISSISHGGVALKGEAYFGGSNFGMADPLELGEIDASASINPLEGLKVDATIEDMTIGDLLTLKGNRINVIAMLDDNGTPNVHFKINGEIDFLAQKQKVEMVFNEKEASFKYEYAIPDFLTGTVTATTLNGLHFSADNTMIVKAELQGDLQDDFLKSFGKNLSNSLDELDKEYGTLQQDLDKKSAELEENKIVLEEKRNDVLRDRKKVTDAVNDAEKKVDTLEGQISKANDNAGKAFNAKCEKHYEIPYYTISNWKVVKRYKKIYYTDYYCKAEKYAEGIGYKAEALTYETAKLAADAVLEAVKKSIDYFPVDADPRVLEPLAKFEISKAAYQVAFAAIEASKAINSTLSDLSSQLEIPDVLANSFYLENVTMQGELNAFKPENTELSVSIDAIVFGQEINRNVTIRPNDLTNVQKILTTQLDEISYSKVASEKEANNKSKFYTKPAREALVFDWKQLNKSGKFKDIAATKNFVYAVGVDGKLWRLKITLSTENQKELYKWEKVDLSILGNDYTITRLDAKGDLVYFMKEVSESNMFIYNENTDVCKHLNGTSRDVAIGKDNTLWHVANADSSADLYSSKDEGKTWSKLAAGAKRLAVTNEGGKFHIGDDGAVWNSDTNKFVGETKFYASDVYATGENLFVRASKNASAGIEENSSWIYSKILNNFILTSGETSGLTMHNNFIYSINAKDNTVWKAPLPEILSDWKLINGVQLNDVAASSDGSQVWGVDKKGNLVEYKSFSKEWVTYNNMEFDTIKNFEVKKIAVEDNGVVLGISAAKENNNQIVKYRKQSSSWVPFINSEDLKYETNQLDVIQKEIEEAKQNKEITYWKWIALTEITRHESSAFYKAIENLERFKKDYKLAKDFQLYDEDILKGKVKSLDEKFEKQEVAYWKWIALLDVIRDDSDGLEKAINNLTRFKNSYSIKVDFDETELNKRSKSQADLEKEATSLSEIRTQTQNAYKEELADMKKIKDKLLLQKSALDLAEKNVSELVTKLKNQYTKVDNMKSASNPKAYEIAANGWYIDANGFQKQDKVGSELYKYNNQTGSYTHIDYGLRIAYSNRTGKVYAIGGNNDSHNLWQANPNEEKPKWDVVSKKYTYAKEVTISPDGVIWTIGKNDDIWWYKNGGWSYITGKSKKIAFSKDKIFRIGLDGRLYETSYFTKIK